MKAFLIRTSIVCIFLTGFPRISNSQTIIIEAGLNVVAQGNLNLVVNNGGIRNEGVFTPGNSKVIFDGAAATAVSGSQPISFYNVLFKGTGTKVNDGSASVISTVAVEGNTVLDADGFANDKSFTLKSSDTATASVDVLTTGNIVGDAIVERYINTGTGTGQHGKSWQLLATPASGQTCYQAWQEGGASPAGFGTWITGTGTGFDAATATTSVKLYNEASGGWTAVTNTNNQLQNKLGYMIFIRGDRNANAFNSLPNPTNMRSKGTLYTPFNPPPSVPVTANRYQTFGNPYASRIEFNKVFQLSTGIRDVYYVWDPKLNGNYGLGGYQTLSGVAGYVPTSGSATTYYSAGVPAPYIESGQAVFVLGDATGGNVQFNEQCKVPGNRLVARNPVSSGSLVFQNRQFLFSSLFTQSGIPADGNIVAFEDGLGNQLNEHDAQKLPNPGENFSITRGGQLLAVEAHDALAQQDTIFFHLQNLKKQPYQFRFATVNLPQYFQAYLVDRFTNISTVINLTDSSFVNFVVTADAGSSMPDRFMLVFQQSVVVPVFFVAVNAYKNNNGNNIITWNVSNELSLQDYYIESSSDGIHFSSIGTVLPSNNNGGSATYHFTDQHPFDALNYYRIKARSQNGQLQFSRIVKLAMPAKEPTILVSPNPAKGNKIHLQFRNQSTGTYRLSIINSLAQTVHQETLVIDQPDASRTIQPVNILPAGVYQIVLEHKGQTKTVVQLLIQ
jgi:hypothetical protein